MYFPGDGFCSLLTVLKDGKMVEVATIGAEGMVGISAMMNGQPQGSLSMVQAHMNTCYRMPVDTFRAEMEARGSFFRASVELSRGARRVHHAVDRLQRRALRRAAAVALAAHGPRRVRRDDFPLTQEFVAMMLGASRPSVTLVAGALQKAA